MREQGRVIAVGEGVVDVRMEISAACDGCQVCSAGSAAGETVMSGVRDSLGAAVGDTVEVVIPDSLKRRAVVAVFVVPVAALFAGYLAGFLLGRWLHVDPDVAGLITAFGAAILAFAGVRMAERTIRQSDRLSPQVGAIIARGHDLP